MDKIVALAALSCLFAGARPTSAEPYLEQPLLVAIKSNFLDRLASDTCAPYFRLYSTEAENWVWLNPTAVKVHVVFYVEYTSARALYGTAQRAQQCLGRDSGQGFFEQGKTYRSADFIYHLSKWALGWHVDKIEDGVPSGGGPVGRPVEAVQKMPPSRDAQDLYNDGFAHFVRGDYDEAIIAYTSALAADPDFAMAYNNRCLVRVIAGRDVEAARADCREAVSRAGDRADVRETQGFVRLKLSESRAALAEYNAALALDARRPIALYGRGIAKARLGDSRGSVADKEHALRLDPGVARAFSVYGVH
ncbi:MAG: hypothetical protein KIT25_12060 [Enhydrobacter sp.]|nr:MAG: hypothetical protein KIT25_12060 [Enhydrobacter sp.]